MENKTSKIQVIIAAKHFLYRLGLKTIISVIGIDPEITEIGSLSDLKSFLNKGYKPDFIIMNNDISDESILDQITAIEFPCRTMLIGDKGQELVKGRFEAICLENQKEIVEKFQEFFFEPESKQEPSTDKSLLSEREIDVLKTVALGLSNKEIADKLCISAHTVITHRKNITEKLGIKTIAGLTVYAIMNGIINPEEVNQ